MDALLAHINKFTPLNADEQQVISGSFKNISVKKKAFLLSEGDVCRSSYFVEKGCLRMYYITEKGTEQITQFALENWWLTDHMSLMMQKPSLFFIQAVENAEVAMLDYNKQEELLQKVPKMERYFRLMMQRGYGAMQMRVKYLHDFSKEEAYLQFSTLFPDFVQRVPQYMLASYLGLTPEYLSEIRKKKQ